MRASIAAVVGALVVTACGPRTPATSSPDVASAGAFVDSFLVQLAHPEGPSRGFPFDTAGFVWGRSGSLLTRDSLVAILHSHRTARTAIVLGTSDVRFTPLGGDVAWSGIISGVVRDSSGAERPVRGALTLVLRHHTTGWRIAAGHESVRPVDEVHEAGPVQ